MQEISKGEMSVNFHEYVRHLVSCGDSEGNLTAKLQEVRAHLVDEVGEIGEDELVTDPVRRQRQLELMFLDGYLDGPGPASVDIAYDRQVEDQHAAETAPKPRRKGRQ